MIDFIKYNGLIAFGFWCGSHDIVRTLVAFALVTLIGGLGYLLLRVAEGAKAR